MATLAQILQRQRLFVSYHFFTYNLIKYFRAVVYASFFIPPVFK